MVRGEWDQIDVDVHVDLHGYGAYGEIDGDGQVEEVVLEKSKLLEQSPLYYSARRTNISAIMHYFNLQSDCNWM
jgi:hypothetical protein